MLLPSERVWQVSVEISSFLVFCWSRLLAELFDSLERATSCLLRLMTQSDRLWSLAGVFFLAKCGTFHFPWLVKQFGRVLISSGLSILCTSFIFRCSRLDSVKSGKGFTFSKSSKWSGVVLRELFGNVLSTSTVSSVPRGSVNNFWSPGTGLRDLPLKLFWGGGSIGGSSYVKYCFVRFTCIEPFCNFPWRLATTLAVGFDSRCGN